MRINNGDGIETKLSDAETKDIIDNIIIPEFKKGNYFQGLRNAIVETTRDTIKGQNLCENHYQDLRRWL